MTFQTILNSIPDAKELRRRAILFTKIDEKIAGSQTSFVTNYNGLGFDRYFWEDGGGQEANIIFVTHENGEESVLMFAYDHESAFNYYDEERDQQIVFDTLPEPLLSIVNGDSLKWSWDKDPHTIVYSTSAAWKIAGEENWTANPEFIRQLDEEGENGGFIYCFDLFLRPLDKERIVKNYADVGYEENDLQHIEEIFSTYYINTDSK